MRRSQMTEFKKAMKSEDFEIKTKICKKNHKKEAPWVFVQTKKIALKRKKKKKPP